MNHKSNGKSTRIAFGVLLAAICFYGFFYRLFPDYTSPNLAPIGGLALFSGFLLSARWGWVAPIAVMAASDLVLWQWKGYQPYLIVYALFALYGVVGGFWRGRLSPLAWVGGVVCSSLVFFLVTNALVFATSSFDPASHPGAWALEIPTDQYAHPLIQYARNLPGLATCYLYALPFYARTLAGDLLFSGLFLMAGALVARLFHSQTVHGAHTVG
ncbi:MAG: DUF6580 family putative transport protein [Gemmataceae bacterium]